jgi:hypothetical protein
MPHLKTLDHFRAATFALDVALSGRTCKIQFA